MKLTRRWRTGLRFLLLGLFAHFVFYNGWYMNSHIRFYGRVVDQDGNALSQVRVKLSVRQWYGVLIRLPIAGFPKTTVTSDANGIFKFKGSGDVLSIDSLEEEGFEWELTGKSFGYGTSEQFKPDPKKPIVFRMWNSGLKQPLITNEKRFSIIPDGKLHTVDLITGTLKEGEVEGDLRISLKRDPSAAWTNKYEWAFRVEVVGGGLREERGDRQSTYYESMFVAPTNNYNQKLEMVFHAEDKEWTDTIHKNLYLQTRNGQMYGRMDFQVYGHYNYDEQGALRIKYAVNPSGSPILW